MGRAGRRGRWGPQPGEKRVQAPSRPPTDAGPPQARVSGDFPIYL